MAMASMPAFWCLTWDLLSAHSSAKVGPKMLSDPVPLPFTTSPPWVMKPFMMRCSLTPL